MEKIIFVRATGLYDDSRASKEIMALLEAGYIVDAIGWDRDGRAKEEAPETFKKYLDRISFNFYEKDAKNGLGGIKGIGKELGWQRFIKKCVKKEKEFFAIHCCDLDSVLGLEMYIKRRKLHLIYDIFDYYVDSHNFPSVLSETLESKEIKAINMAYATIICTEERREQIAKATPKQVVVIHNSPDIANAPQNDEIYDFAYCGMMYDKRLIQEILEGYPKHAGLKFAFAGNGPFSSMAADLGAKYSELTYFGPIPYAKVLEIESKAKVISAIYEPMVRNHRLCAPNKFYEALALGKPLIVCKGTGIDKIVEENKLGFAINYDADEFYEALLYLTSHEDERKEMGERARLLYEEKYKWSFMKEKLIALYKGLENEPTD